MIKNFKKIQIFTSVLLVLILTIGDCAFAKDVSRVPKSKTASSLMDFSIPKDLGSVVEFFHAEKKDAPFIAIVLNAHSVQSAQEKNQMILKHLDDEYGFNWVGAEGAHGKLDPLLLKAFPVEDIKKKVLELSLAQGEITGVEWDAIFNQSNSAYEGIEDWKLYEQNYIYYLRALAEKESWLPILKKNKALLDREAKKRLSDDQLTLLKASADHDHEARIIYEKIEILRKLYEQSFVQEGNEFALKFPSLKMFQEMFQEQADGVDEYRYRDHEDFFERLKKHVSKQLDRDSQMKLNRFNQQYLIGEISRSDWFHQLLKYNRQIDEPLVLPFSIQQAFESELSFEFMGNGQFIKEFRSLIKDLSLLLFSVDEDEIIYHQYRYIAELQQLIHLNLDREGWEFLKSDFSLMTNFLTGVELPSAIHFYEKAEERDDEFARALKQTVEKGKHSKLALVVGGFHQSGLVREFKAMGYSYAVIRPQVDSLAGHENYRVMMSGQASYRDEAGESYFESFMSQTAKKLIDEIPDGKRNEMLRDWRDEIIRHLAEEGRLVESKKYLNFVDYFIEKGIGTTRKEMKRSWNSNISEIIERHIEKAGKNYRNQFDKWSAQYLSKNFGQLQKTTPNQISLLEAPLVLAPENHYFKWQPNDVLNDVNNSFLSHGQKGDPKQLSPNLTIAPNEKLRNESKRSELRLLEDPKVLFSEKDLQVVERLVSMIFESKDVRKTLYEKRIPDGFASGMSRFYLPYFLYRVMTYKNVTLDQVSVQDFKAYYQQFEQDDLFRQTELKAYGKMKFIHPSSQAGAFFSFEKSFYPTERENMKSVIRMLVRKKIEENDRQIKMFFNGTSTGEEVLSTAGILYETMKEEGVLDFSQWDIRMIGTDAQPERLYRAKYFRFSSSNFASNTKMKVENILLKTGAFERVDNSEIPKVWQDQIGEDSLKLIPEIQDWIQYYAFNLYDLGFVKWWMRHFKEFDIVFSRNNIRWNLRSVSYGLGEPLTQEDDRAFDRIGELTKEGGHVVIEAVSPSAKSSYQRVGYDSIMGLHSGIYQKNFLIRSELRSKKSKKKNKSPNEKLVTRQPEIKREFFSYGQDAIQVKDFPSWLAQAVISSRDSLTKAKNTYDQYVALQKEMNLEVDVSRPLAELKKLSDLFFEIEQTGITYEKYEDLVKQFELFHKEVDEVQQVSGDQFRENLLEIISKIPREFKEKRKGIWKISEEPRFAISPPELKNFWALDRLAKKEGLLMQDLERSLGQFVEFANFLYLYVNFALHDTEGGFISAFGHRIENGEIRSINSKKIKSRTGRKSVLKQMIFKEFKTYGLLYKGMKLDHQDALLRDAAEYYIDFLYPVFSRTLMTPASDLAVLEKYLKDVSLFSETEYEREVVEERLLDVVEVIERVHTLDDDESWANRIPSYELLLTLEPRLKSFPKIEKRLSPFYHRRDVYQQSKAHRYFALNKPLSVLSTREDEHGDRETVFDLFKNNFPAVDNREYLTLGRLDYDVDGLMIITDDVASVDIILPASHMEKHYRIVLNQLTTGKMDNLFTDEYASKLAEGVVIQTTKGNDEIHDYHTRPARVEIEKSSSEESIIHLYITEGKYHQVKKMFEAVGFSKIRLVRQGIGNIELLNLNFENNTMIEMQGASRMRFLEMKAQALMVSDGALETDTVRFIHQLMATRNNEMESLRSYSYERIIASFNNKAIRENVLKAFLSAIKWEDKSADIYITHLFMDLLDRNPAVLESFDSPSVEKSYFLRVLLEVLLRSEKDEKSKLQLYMLQTAGNDPGLMRELLDILGEPRFGFDQAKMASLVAIAETNERARVIPGILDMIYDAAATEEAKPSIPPARHELRSEMPASPLAGVHYFDGSLQNTIGFLTQTIDWMLSDEFALDEERRMVLRNYRDTLQLAEETKLGERTMLAKRDEYNDGNWKITIGLVEVSGILSHLQSLRFQNADAGDTLFIDFIGSSIMREAEGLWAAQRNATAIAEMQKKKEALYDRVEKVGFVYDVFNFILGRKRLEEIAFVFSEEEKMFIEEAVATTLAYEAHETKHHKSFVELIKSRGWYHADEVTSILLLPEHEIFKHMRENNLKRVLSKASLKESLSEEFRALTLSMIFQAIVNRSLSKSHSPYLFYGFAQIQKGFVSLEGIQRALESRLTDLSSVGDWQLNENTYDVVFDVQEKIEAARLGRLKEMRSELRKVDSLSRDILMLEFENLQNQIGLFQSIEEFERELRKSAYDVENFKKRVLLPRLEAALEEDTQKMHVFLDQGVLARETVHDRRSRWQPSEEDWSRFFTSVNYRYEQEAFKDAVEKVLKEAYTGFDLLGGDTSLAQFKISPELEMQIRFLLNLKHRRILQEAFSELKGETLDLSLPAHIMMDAFFFEKSDPVKSKNLIQSLLESGTFFLAYRKGSETVAGVQEIFRTQGIRRQLYQDSQKIPGISKSEKGQHFYALLEGVALSSNEEMKENIGASVSKSVYYASRLSAEEWLTLTQIILQVDYLKEQLEETDGFPAITDKVLNAVFDLLNQLAETNIARSAILQSA